MADVRCCGFWSSRTGCLRDLVFPLLADLLDVAKEQHSLGAASTDLGKDRGTGTAVKMVVHHSRDTAEKQLDETRVYALQVCSRPAPA